VKSAKALAAGAVVGLSLALPGIAAAQGQSVQLQLEEFNNTGASGTATLTPTSDGGLRVQIQTSGLVPNAARAAHPRRLRRHRLHVPVDGRGL
jgi:hypothetical protein